MTATRVRHALAALLALLLVAGAASDVMAQAPPRAAMPLPAQLGAPAPTQSTTQPTTQSTTQPSYFRDITDGAFDVSEFLSTRVGFLPIAMPITEPAVGYGFSLGLSFFHDKPKVVDYPDQPPRVIMPSITAVFGAATENGTWAGGLAHIGVWNDGKIRYVGVAGYANLNLDWFGKGDSLGDHSISYTNDILFIYQKITFKLGDSNFFLGPQYRFIASDAGFARDSAIGGVPASELQSQTGGLGVVLAYDSLDQPFSPTRGIRADVVYSQQGEAFGGDFNYGKLNSFLIGYIPLGNKFVLGLRGDVNAITSGDAPFYDLPSLMMRGLKRGEHVDNIGVQMEAELRYDLTQRWSLIGFTGVGRVAENFGDIGSADTHYAIGAGFRYLIARQYGLRLGLDTGYSDDGDWSIYVTMGTGWVRP